MNAVISKPVIVENRLHPDNTIPKGDWVWVFGSNEAGRHGKGAAKVAHVSFKAQYGVGIGLTGKSYAIPTKDSRLQSLPLQAIEKNVADFLSFAAQNPKLSFYVTRVGCGLAGYTDEDIGPMFSGAPANCSLPEEWEHLAGPAPQSLSAPAQCATEKMQP